MFLAFEERKQLIEEKQRLSAYLNGLKSILKRNPYLDAKESFFASSGENDWQAIKRLCYFLYRHHKVLPIILVDEYDTPLLEAYTQGYWDEMIATCRQIFHNAFKQNDFYSRAIITGVTRITLMYMSKRTVDADLKNRMIAF